MSPQRIDYYHSPDAPKANSLVPAVNVVVANDAGEILLIRRTDNGNWALPGGAIDLGESSAPGGPRDTRGDRDRVRDHRHRRHLLRPQARDPLHRQRRGTTGVLHRPHRPATERQPTPSSESSDVRWVPPSELPGYTMDRSMRIRLNDFLARKETPAIT
jgi:8-oxo-dGTP pyrophosphatase MutT (NUDIX family)